MRWIEITGTHIHISNEEKLAIQKMKDDDKFVPEPASREEQLYFNLVSRGVLERFNGKYRIRKY